MSTLSENYPMADCIHRYALIGLAFVGYLSVSTKLAHAQVVPDGTLPSAVSSPDNLNFTIDQGTRSGNNLFHSFSQFSIPTGGAAIFDHAPDVQNIFSRVTGGAVSNIDGLIQANGMANLFLLNPSGIVFGPNAKLNIGGSFLGTTASRIQFADGMAFGTVNPTALLTMSVPIGVQFGQNPGTIAVQNTGHRLSQGLFTPVALNNSTSGGLTVQPSNTLALLGGDINLVGGILSAPSGQIELGSSKAGTVDINTTKSRWQFDYRNVAQFADIQLSKQALVDASGSPAGSLRLQGRNISLIEGSVALLKNSGGTGLGNLIVNASETLALGQVGTYGFQNSLLIADNVGSGNGNNILISARNLQLQNGGQITTRTFGAGTGGNIDINVSGLMTLDRWSSIDPSLPSLIGTKTFGSAPSGGTSISTHQLRATNGGVVGNTSLGKATAGDVIIHADDWIELMGENSFAGIPSALSSITFSQGNSGNLSITTSRLTVRDGAVVNTSTLSFGNAGKTTVTALEQIEVSGTNPSATRTSRIASAATISGPFLQRAFRLPPVPTGNAGDVILNTPLLYVHDQGAIGIENEGMLGNAGQLTINANRLVLDQKGLITATTKSGSGGNIILNLRELLSLRHQSLLTTTSSGKGDGGNIGIYSPIILGIENSDFIANAVAGRGGNINIATQGILGLKYRDRLTPDNDITASSEFGISGTVQVNTIGVDPNSGLVTLPVDIVDPSQKIATGCAASSDSSFVATGRGGMPQSPMQVLDVDRPWSDLRTFANSKSESRIAAVLMPIEATALATNSQGQTELIAPGAIASPQIVATCAR
jgi:filamentous hemagglutinin family protein